MEASNVDLILRARAFGVGPWGRRPGAIVALYAALYVEDKIGPTEDPILVEINETARGGAPFRVVCPDPCLRACWEERLAKLLQAFREDGWRSFPELNDPDAGAIP